MPTNYPNSIDSFVDPTAGQPQNNPSHSSQHTNLNDAMLAVQTAIGTTGAPNFAPLVTPHFTGTPTSPTAGAGNNTTQIATTSFVTTAVGTETTRATTAEALLAPKASPALTGVPTAPTAASTTNTTQIATTAMVQAAVTAGAGGLTGLTGDVTASGTGSQPATLVATTNTKNIIQENLGIPIFYVGNPTYTTAGAIGVGNAAHDTAALTAAAAAAVSNGSGIVMFPAGTFNINTFPTFSGVTAGLYYAVRGPGSNVCTINAKNSTLATSLTVNAPTDFITGGPKWGGFTLDGTGASSTAVGIAWSDVSYVTFEDIQIQNYTSGDGMYFHNVNGWCEGVTMIGVRMNNCANAIHFAVASTGFPSFDYWNVQSLYFNLNANQNGWVDEAGLNTVAPSDQIQRIGSTVRIVANCNNGATNTGKLFWFKGNTQWIQGVFDIHCEVDGGAATNHTSFVFANSSAGFSGCGSVLLLGSFQSPSFNGGAYQINLAGQAIIPGWATTTAPFLITTGAGTAAGGKATWVFNQPSAPTITSGTAWVNNLGSDVTLYIPYSLASAATLKFVQQSFTIAGAGSTLITATTGENGIFTVLVHTNEQIRIDISSGSIGTTQAFWG